MFFYILERAIESMHDKMTVIIDCVSIRHADTYVNINTWYLLLVFPVKASIIYLLQHVKKYTALNLRQTLFISINPAVKSSI